MRDPLISDELWNRSAPLFPEEPPIPRGRKPLAPGRAWLAGIIVVPKSGIPGELLPQNLGCGPGMIFQRRLKDRQNAGDDLWRANQPDWGLVLLGDHECAGQQGGTATGAGPTDRNQSGTKRHRVSDRLSSPARRADNGARTVMTASSSREWSIRSR